MTSIYSWKSERKNDFLDSVGIDRSQTQTVQTKIRDKNGTSYRLISAVDFTFGKNYYVMLTIEAHPSFAKLVNVQHSELKFQFIFFFSVRFE